DGSKGKIETNKLNYGNNKLSVAKSLLKYEAKHYLVSKIYKAELFKNSEIIAYKNFSKSSDEFLFFQVLQYCERIVNINNVVYYYFDNQESASYNKSNPKALSAMITSLNYVDSLYKDEKDIIPILQKWKLDKYTKFISISENDT